jgi:hypothetical protein
VEVDVVDAPRIQPLLAAESGSSASGLLTLNEALRLAAAGFHVGITAPLEKRPHSLLMARGADGSPGGVWMATIDVEVIRGWWAFCPGGGLFVSPRGQLVALDVDDPNRFEELVGPGVAQQMQSDYPCTRTPSGGCHFWFRLPASSDAKSLPRQMGFGEFIYESFYALVPPSRAQAKDGTTRNYVAIVPLPDDIGQVPPIASEHLRLILPAVIPCVAELGNRHNTLLQMGTTLAHAEASSVAIEAALRNLNTNFSPPMAGHELQREIEGILRWLADRAVLKGTTPGPTKLTFLSMQQLAELPAPRWLILNLIPDASLGVLIAPPGGGKSFFLLELAMAICRGVALFGDCQLMPSRVGWVLVLLPEAAGSWAARVRAYREFHGIEFCDDFVCCIEQNDLADAATWAQVLAAVQAQIAERGGPPVLVIVDTLSASIPGRDENSQSEMTLLTSHLQSLVAMGSCVIVAHHTTKYTSKYRGSSVLLGSCDWMISIVTSGRVREFQSVKVRNAEGIISTAFEIKPHGESAVCVGLDVPGPWAQFETITRGHPGLREALRKHGFQVPGEARSAPPSEDVCTKGASLKTLQSTWNRLDPIAPTNVHDPAGYKAVHGARTTALLGLVGALCRGGVLEVTKGDLSRKTRDLSTVVRQKVTDEDE